MPLTVNLNFDLQNADHRRVAEWLSVQADPVEAIARLIAAADEGARRAAQWEELLLLLGKETREMGARLAGLTPDAPQPAVEVPEDPESAHRLDSMFG